MELENRQICAAVIGHPIAHSRSPMIHNGWLAQAGIEGTYTTFDVPPEGLESFCNELRQSTLKGINVTLPHKEKIMSLCDEVDETAQQIGAVNTILIKDRKLTATNTDAYGFIQNLKKTQPEFDLSNSTPIVLGAGGAARAVLYGLLNEGVQNILLTNRTYDNALKLSKDFKNIEVIDWDNRSGALTDCNLVVNTTSLGMKGQPALDLNLAKLPPQSLVYDLVYNPLETELLKNAARHECRTVQGLGMLIYQAEKAFRLWFDTTPDITVNLHQELEKSL